MSKLHRYPTLGAPVFVTAVCRDRIPFLAGNRNKELFLSCLRDARKRLSFRVKAYVLLDDHVHLLLLPGDGELSKIMQSIKLRFTRKLKTAAGEMGAGCWQSRFWDHIIRDDEDWARHLDYIHYNPVKHGYSPAPGHYKYSSYRYYLSEGGYDAGWGVAVEPPGQSGLNFE